MARAIAGFGTCRPRLTPAGKRTDSLWKFAIQAFAYLAAALCVLIGIPETRASELLISSAGTNEIRRYDGSTGAFIDAFVTTGSGGLSSPHGLVFGPDNNLYVSSYGTNQILRYDGSTGAFIGAFVTAGSGGLSTPHGLTFGPDGNLYVSNYHSGVGTQVLRYNGSTGAFIDVFVNSGSGLAGPTGLVFGPDGSLYVSSEASSEILRYDGLTGAFIGAFVTAHSGGLIEPEYLVFGPGSDLYVPSLYSYSVLRYNGSTGAFIGSFVSDGGYPLGLVFGPDDNLYVTSVLTNVVNRYDGTTGAFIGEFTRNISQPHGLAFRPTAAPLPLFYTPVNPCRLADTRVAGSPLRPRAGQAFSATDPTLIAAVGGNSSGCGIPVGPQALMLTLTAVLPGQVGNLVAYRDGDVDPLANALNFLAGQIIANTTVVPSTAKLGLNFDIYNNSDGATDVVVDIVGYFWEYQASDCTKVTNTQSVAAGGTPDVVATCAAGYVSVGGGCSTDTPGASNWLARTATAPGDGYRCTMLNGTGVPVNVSTDAMCCRRAGR